MPDRHESINIDDIYHWTEPGNFEDGMDIAEALCYRAESNFCRRGVKIVGKRAVIESEIELEEQNSQNSQ